MIVGFHVTDRCQLDCRHCLRDPEKRPTDLEPELVARVVREARRLHGARHVVLTGGEPTLHPELDRVIDAAIDAGCSWHLVTNGVRFDKLLAILDERPLRRERLVNPSFSVDGADEAVHDAIRGAGSFRAVATAIAACHARGIRWVAQMVVNAKNERHIEAVGSMIAELGGARLSYAFMQATGTEHDRDLALSPREWFAVRDRIDRVASILKMPVEAAEGFPRADRFRTCAPFAGASLHVDVHGRLSLCCQHSDVPGTDTGVAGDLREVPLLEAHARLLEIIHDARVAQLRALDGPRGAWDDFGCNACLARFGRPHWTSEGTGGAVAARERTRGKRLPIYASSR